MCIKKAKLEQKLKYEKKTKRKRSKTSMPSCQNLSTPSSRANPRTGCGFGANSQWKLTRQMFHRSQSFFSTSRSFWRLQFDHPPKATNERRIFWKQKFRKESKIINGYVSSIMSLPRPCWTQLAKRAGRNFCSSSFSSAEQQTSPCA